MDKQDRTSLTSCSGLYQRLCQDQAQALGAPRHHKHLAGKVKVGKFGGANVLIL